MKKEIISSKTTVAQFDSGWSTRALNFLGSLPGDQSVFQLYLYHISNGSRGILKALNVGKVTYNEIREELTRKGFPDLKDPLFSELPNNPNTRAMLRAYLDGCRSKSRRVKENLRMQLMLCKGRS